MFVVFLLIAAGMGSQAYSGWGAATTVLQQQVAATFGVGAVIALAAAVGDIWTWRMSARIDKLREGIDRLSDALDDRR